MSKIKSKSKIVKRSFISPFKNYWTKTNYILGGIGFLVLLLGFFLMAQGPWDNPISLSPIVLLLAYLIIFPLSILYRKRKERS